MELRTLFGTLLVVIGVLQFLAVPGYYHSDARLLAMGIATVSVAAGYVVLPRSRVSIRT